MSKVKRKIDSRQGGLFEYLKPERPPAPGSLNVSARIRQAVSSAIKKSDMDRVDIRSAIYKLTGHEVAKSTHDNWSAESRDLAGDIIDHNGNKRWGMSVDVLAAFCHVCGDYEILFVLVEACNYKARKGKDVVRARAGYREKSCYQEQHLESHLSDGHHR